MEDSQVDFCALTAELRCRDVKEARWFLSEWYTSTVEFPKCPSPEAVPYEVVWTGAGRVRHGASIPGSPLCVCCSLLEAMQVSMLNVGTR